jgi:phosphopantothenoylcysteine decarboxylase/phosphopantothenate--cysteine ligase
MTITFFENKKILFGVCGSIAAYKSAWIASRLTQAGARVDTIMTESATKFVSPLTFQSLTGRAARLDLWFGDTPLIHLELARDADALLIAPATANTLAKLAHGQADTLLTVTALAATCPVLIAPAMDGEMYSHPAVQSNVEVLRERGAIVLGPTDGRMASGQVGLGRMIEPDEIIAQTRFHLARNGALKGKRIVVTAGGTQEAIDPVRVITNRSSGKQGFAVAQAALDLGAEVTLIVGTSHLATPFGATRIDAPTAQLMRDAVLNAMPSCDALVMVAAVADFRPIHSAQHKIKKTEVPTIELERTDDILSAVAEIRRETSRPRVVVGFAAETRNVVQNALDKIERKSLSMIVANDVSSLETGFSVDTNRVTFVYPDGQLESLPLMSKSLAAEALIDRLRRLLDKSA